MKASILIITKNQKYLLEKSLPVLLHQNFKEKYEIVVVDSGSTDGAREYVKSLGLKLVKINPDTFRFASAFNAGAKNTQGEILVRLSGDVIPKGKDFLKELLKPFEDPKVGGTYGKYTQTGNENYTHPSFWPPERFPEKTTRYSIKPNFLRYLLDKNYIEEIVNFAGGCCALRRSLWEKRPFNERLLGGDDADYAIFLHLSGYDIVYTPKAEVVHEHKKATLKGSFWDETKWRVVSVREIFRLWFGI